MQQNLFEIDPIDSKKVNSPHKGDTGDFAFDILDALQSPFLTFSTAWADSIPGRVVEIIPLSRMIALMKHERTATYAEVSAYMITRSFEAPLDYDWVQIYTHVSCKTLQDWFNEDRWEIVHAPRELSHGLRSQLDHLRHCIYEKRRQILKDRMKEKTKKSKQPTDLQDDSVDPTRQQSLF